MTAFEGVIDCANKPSPSQPLKRNAFVSNQPSSLKGLRLTLLRGLVCMKCQLESDLTYEEKPIKIFETSERVIEQRLSNSAKFSGVTIRKKKQLGNEKMNFEKTIHTYLLANLNLEGEIHLKGVRLVTSQFLGKVYKFCT
jgi:hypothetical protein